MLIITTAISGSGRSEYLDGLRDYALRHKKKIKIYHIGDMLFEHAKKTGLHLTQENILNSNPAVINAVRGAVFESIIAELPQMLRKYDAVVINVHAMFFWKHVFQRTWDNYYIPQLKPDMFVTFISDAAKVQDHLQARQQWKPMNVTLYDALLWSNVEVEVTAGWAEMLRRRHYVIPVAAPAKLLYRLMFEPKTETAYISMPLTHGYTRAIQKKADQLIKVLEKYYIIFDPRFIELAIPKKGGKVDLIMHNQIVNRDLYWLVRQSKRIIAYFPEVVSSPGVINELREAYETNKEVWLIWPKDATKSPFITYYAHQVFKSPQELLRFLKKK
ncbi:MAG: AAA family ATPase [Patescibacteria group bacterium]